VPSPAARWQSSPASRGPPLPAGVTPEEAEALGAAAGVYGMDPGQVIFGEEVARAAAEGAKQASIAAVAVAAAAAAACTSDCGGRVGNAAGDGNIRLKMMPRIYNYVAAGVSKPSGASGGGGGGGEAVGGVEEEEGEGNGDAAAMMATKEQPAAAARAAALLRRFSGGGWAMTAHEIAQAAAIERGDSTAPGLVDWRASRWGKGRAGGRGVLSRKC
jgi:hypothetical protein